jgi:hypothetical protein
MLALSMLWLVLGLIVAALGLAARLRPASWPASWELRGRLGVFAVGAVAALLGGWLGVFLFGRLFGTPMALWIAVGAVAATPWVVARIARARQRSQQ